jgi:methylated-DNA-[protein]-cysteine S-methyltransferase
MTLHKANLKTAAGEILVVFRGEKIAGLCFADHAAEILDWLRRRFGNEPLEPLRGETAGLTALTAYFGGDLTAIDRVEVDTGGTTFQKRVWDELRKIPAGRTISYAELATRVGDPKATRAVGAANGKNPVSIVVPCHRVVAKGGKLGGYGGGLDRKRWLLAHEGAASLG